MAELPGYVTASQGGTLLSVFVQPGTTREDFVGVHGTSLKVKVRAPAEGGRANRAALELIARTLGLVARDLELVAGASSRHKRFSVPLPPAEVVALLTPVLSSGAQKSGSGRHRRASRGGPS